MRTRKLTGKHTQTAKGDRLHWQPLDEARAVSVALKDATGKHVDEDELYRRGNNGSNNTLVP